MNTENLPSTFDKQEFEIIEQVVMQGDLSKLNAPQRLSYYRKVCESLGLNPFTKPFEYIQLNGKLTLYAKKDATEQIRKIHGISIEGLDDKIVDDIYIVTAKAKSKDGRIDQAKGAVTIGHLKGDAKANAIMKAETKAKRRVTLSMAGLGWIDETEIETIPHAEKIKVNHDTGEIEILPPKVDINKSQIDYDINFNQEPKVNQDQLRQILEGLMMVDDTFKSNYESYKLEKWNAKEYSDLPQRAFVPTMTAINRNKEFNKKKGSNHDD